MTPVNFSALRDVLTKLYPETSKLRIVLDDAGIDSSSIEFKDTSKIDWHSALKEADKTNKISDLLDVVKRDYGNNVEFRKVYQAYHQSGGSNNQTDLISDVSIQEKASSDKDKFTNPSYDNSINEPSAKTENSQPQKQTYDLLRDPIWQFIGVVVALLMPLIQSDPKWYILTAIIVFFVSYLFFETIRCIVNGLVILYFVAIFLTNPAFGEIRSMLKQIFETPVVPQVATDAVNSNQTSNLPFTEVSDTYINLLWRASGCGSEPRLELLPVNQSSEACAPDDYTITLKKLEENLHLIGLIDADEYIETYAKDSIVVKNSAGSMIDYIKIGKDYPIKPFPVGGVWREAIRTRSPERKVCWLRSSKKWVCDDVVN